GLGPRGDAIAVVVDRHDLLRGREPDQARPLAGVVDDIEHVGAMNDAVGRAVLVMKWLIDWHLDDGFGSDRVAELQPLGERAPMEHLRGEAEHLEHAEYVRPE